MASSNNKSSNYHQISLDDFSDDDSSDGGGNSSPTPSNPAGDSIYRQQMLQKQQDEGLEMLSQSANRLGQMSMAISEELGYQNKMLNEMEEDLEEAGDNLDFVTKKTKLFIEQSGGTKNFMIIVTLFVIMIILFFLVIYV